MSKTEPKATNAAPAVEEQAPEAAPVVANVVHKDADITLNPEWVEVEEGGRKFMRRVTKDAAGNETIEERY